MSVFSPISLESEGLFFEFLSPVVSFRKGLLSPSDAGAEMWRLGSEDGRRGKML